MRVEDLSASQLSLLREAKADVIRRGLLHRTCTDQRFLDAVVVMRKNPMIFDVLTGSTRGELSRGLEILTQLAERLQDDNGIWDADGWRAC